MQDEEPGPSLPRLLLAANSAEGVRLGSARVPQYFQIQRVVVDQFVNDRSYVWGARRAEVRYVEGFKL